MNINHVRAELAAALAGIDGLNVLAYEADRVTLPAAFVDWPEPFTFDATMGRGADRATFPILVLVGRHDAESSAEALGAYCDGGDRLAVKTLIESYQPTAFHHARVASIEFGVTTVAGSQCLSALFRVDVIGNGS